MPSVEPLRGVYSITNAYTPGPVVLHLSRGSPEDHGPVVGWNRREWRQATDAQVPVLNQLWLVERVPAGTPDVYTIRNLRGGTYMDLEAGAPANGTGIVGLHPSGTPWQKWIIRKDPASEKHKIQNYHSKTFVDLSNGAVQDGTKIQGWRGGWDYAARDHQTWYFERLSRSSTEIHAALKASPNLAHDFKCYPAEGEYLVLPRGILRGIWETTGLGERAWRKDMFDCDDFALVYKSAVITWGANNIRADNIKLLCGVMMGRSRTLGEEGHAYNFTLEDLRVLFFEPQANDFLDDTPCYPYFGFF